MISHMTCTVSGVEVMCQGSGPDLPPSANLLSGRRAMQRLVGPLSHATLRLHVWMCIVMNLKVHKASVSQHGCVCQEMLQSSW